MIAMDAAAPLTNRSQFLHRVGRMAAISSTMNRRIMSPRTLLLSVWLSLDNQYLCAYSSCRFKWSCHENPIQREKLRTHWGMRKSMAGELRSVVLMPGAGFTVPTTTKNAGAESIAYRVSGVRRVTQRIMPNKFGEWLTTVSGSMNSARYRRSRI